MCSRFEALIDEIKVQFIAEEKVLKSRELFIIEKESDLKKREAFLLVQEQCIKNKEARLIAQEEQLKSQRRALRKQEDHLAEQEINFKAEQDKISNEIEVRVSYTVNELLLKEKEIHKLALIEEYKKGKIHGYGQGYRARKKTSE
jgi:hypothetical protein